ncbi:hypothetical protein L1887_10529 [Cichorium endivia]|nr:hypothetical protein L1887_10529 [Cichorium endivia]
MEWWKRLKKLTSFLLSLSLSLSLSLCNLQNLEQSSSANRTVQITASVSTTGITSLLLLDCRNFSKFNAESTETAGG